MKKSVEILLVEDEVITAMFMMDLLTKAGFNVSNHVTTGENAIIFAEKTNPDIILMDIRLAGEMDGIEAAEKIQTVNNIPVIFITGYDDTIYRERAENLNTLAYLVKPAPISVLKSLIDDYFS